MGLFKAEVRRFTKRRITRYSLLAGGAAFLPPFLLIYLHHLSKVAWREEGCCIPMPDPMPLDYIAPLYPYITKLPYFTLVIALVSYVIGASSVGAEWSSGNMTTLLLRQPGRLRVLLTKLGALVTCVTVTFAAFNATWTGILFGLLPYNGNVFLADVFNYVGLPYVGTPSYAPVNALLLTVAPYTAMLGFAIATTFRNTSAAAWAAASGIPVVCCSCCYVGANGAAFTLATILFEIVAVPTLFLATAIWRTLRHDVT